MEHVEYQKMERLEKNHWWFVAKRKFLITVLQKFFNKHTVEQKNILDVGCGTGANMDFLKQKGFQVKGIDMSEEALKFCKEKGLDVQLGLAGNIPFRENNFDIVIACDVLEHIKNDVEAIKEIARVLKKNGLFIATVPAHQFLWSYHDEALHHIRRYSKRYFKNTVEGCFDIKLISWTYSSILVPSIIGRYLHALFKNSSKTSDVKANGIIINSIMNIICALEVTFFKVFNFLPWGLSLLVVASKK